MTISEAFRSTMKYRWRVLLTFTLLMTLVVLGLVVAPRKYASEAQLFVRLGRESVTLDPTATTGQTVALFESRELELNSIVHLLQSRALAEKVVDQLTPQKILSKRSWPTQESTTEEDFSSRISAAIDDFMTWYKPGVDDRERAIEKFSKALTVYSKKKSGVISVSYEANHPTLAQDVARAVITEYLAEHRRLNRTEGSYEFFNQQHKVLAAEVRKYDEALRDAKNQLGITSLEGMRLRLQRHIGDIESSIIKTKSDVAEAVSKIRIVDEKLATVPARLDTQEEDAANEMRHELFVLEIKEKELASRFADNDPRLKQIRAQVAQARSVLDATRTVKSQSTDVNPNHMSLELSLISTQAELEGYQSKLVSLEQQKESVHQQIDDLNRNAVLLEELRRQAKISEENLFGYAEKQEQARIDHALNATEISNVNISQHATFVPDPVAPRTSLTLIVGTIAAFCGAILVAVLSKLFNHSVQSVEQIEESLDLPVLVSIPNTPAAKRLIA